VHSTLFLSVKYYTGPNVPPTVIDALHEPGKNLVTAANFAESAPHAHWLTWAGMSAFTKAVVPSAFRGSK
jgi:hypothetical protein